ncbi:Ku protein [Desulfosporosinus nitroreducens]|uniref:Non-homologous end joining protein Ku n=1 Tax=Desulfosporosinus nitroreducens TaxID=2018668 RepID=A0ABT8QVE1_9FIRM|nr:Ku protein [Desulfosporosinus nitroreducens]MCO1601768.1 Ku protein [Desulfosporosinus nitroreducens]MDO0824837.1 Ku protein [Desulfosporosinus nitroreducens]
MHTLWKGSISFGLVNVPVKMHAATESQEFKFNYLHEDCKNRIRSIKKCPACDIEVGTDDLVKGFEYEKDRYVVLSEDDLASLEQPMSRSIDILDFINLPEIDPIYYQKSYYLSPEETAMKAYKLLCQSMEESGKVALARVTMRSKQHLACLRVFEKGLVMETMHYPKEIRHMDVVWDSVVPTEAELTMARQLIENLARPFEPEKYHDELHEQMVGLIESKIAGESYQVDTPAKGGKVVDLMEALRASIALTENEKGQLKASDNDEGPIKPLKSIKRVQAEKPIKAVESKELFARVEKDEESDGEKLTDQGKSTEKPKSTLTPRKRTTRRAKEA